MNDLKNVNEKSVAAVILVALSIVASFVLSPLAGPALGANSLTSNVVATVNVPATCFIDLSTNTINFGSLAPTAQYPANQLIVDTNSGGNIAANVLVDGGNWIGTNTIHTFYVTNTIWNPASSNTFTPSNDLTSTLSDTQIVAGAGLSANVFFGVQIPAGQIADTYTQTINIENSC